MNASTAPSPFKAFYESTRYWLTFRVFHGTWALGNVCLESHRLVRWPRGPNGRRRDRRPLVIFAFQVVANTLRFIFLVVAGAFATSNLPFDIARSLLTASQPLEISSGLIVAHLWSLVAATFKNEAELASHR